MRYTKIALFTFAILAVFVSCASDSKSLSVDPKNVDFEAVHIGDSVTKNVTLTNKYGKEISISEISLSGSGDFYITSVIPSPLILANKEEHVLTLEYSPSNPGPTTALMTIKHSGATKDKEVIIEGEGVAVPRITVPVDTYDFQTALINTTITHDFYIENSGTAAMSINNFNLLGSGFSISAGGNTPVNIAVGASHMITVEFAPIVATTYNVVITISCDAVNNSPEKTITIDGEGVTVTPKITLNRTDPWDFGQVTSNQPLTMDLKMENTGGDPLTISDVQLNTGTDFFITSIEDSNNLPISLPQVLQPGTFIYAMVKFEPTVTSLLNDKLIITHDAINAAKPLEMTVKGDGTFVKEKNYYYTGAVQTWTIPAGITKITIECWGAQGETTFGVGGKGGYATGDLVVSPGETISIYVGGQKGWNGGGPNSVGGGTSGGVSAPGGYGGGASDVRQGGNNLTDRKIVAGGGGGGGGDGAGSVYGKGGDGGAGGGSVGNAGVNGNGGTAGQGGTQTAGGTYGTGNSNCSITGESGKVGQLGLGGDGGDGIQGCGGYTGGGGGGGGGGYFGGGGAGGAAAGSGGAWSGGGGGGGSSYIGGVTNSSTQTGIRTGDGEVKITWQ